MAGVMLGLAPLAMLVLWHLVTMPLSVGMMYLVVEDRDDLDSGLVAFAILAMGLTGALLGKFAGLGWLVMFLLALPSLGMTGALLVKASKP